MIFRITEHHISGIAEYHNDSILNNIISILHNTIIILVFCNSGYTNRNTSILVLQNTRILGNTRIKVFYNTEIMILTIKNTRILQH